MIKRLIIVSAILLFFSPLGFAQDSYNGDIYDNQTSVRIFLKIDGVDGEAINVSHNKEIDVLSFNWGITQTGSMQVGGGGGAGKPIVDDVVLAKYIDKASPRLLFACLKGEHFIEAILTVAMINGAETFDKVVIKMTDVLVTSINSGVNETYGGIIENVALNFAKVEFIYTPQTLGGSGDAQIDFTWNLERNTDEGVSW